jgi:predicted alpha/beta superfamily hydrolase
MRILLLLIATLPLAAHEPERITLGSKVMSEVRRVVVHLPESYAGGEQRYPVLYVTDGATQAAHTAATVKALSGVLRMPEVIVVGVDNTDRIRDLTPTAVESDTVDGAVTRFPTSGRAATFLSFFESELIPEIEKRYRTQPYRILAGHSFGAMFALETLYAKPKLFNAVIAVSPTAWWDNGYLLRRAKQYVASKPELNATLILAIGEEGPQMNVPYDELKAYLTANAPKGLTVHSYHFADDDHVTVPVPATYAALRKLFAPWFFRVLPGDDPKQLWPRAVAHAQEMTKRYGFEVRVSEERGNRIGNLLLNAKLYDDAIAVFEANAAAYPHSPNVYKVLGEAYEKAGNPQKARENFAKARDH